MKDKPFNFHQMPQNYTNRNDDFTHTYKPPGIGEMNKVGNYFSNPPNPTNFSARNFKNHNLIYIDNRIATFNQYNSIMLCLFVFSIFALFGSIFDFSSDNQRDGYIEIIKSKWRHSYDVINFFVNMLHIGGYFYGMQAYNKQNSKMNKHFQNICIGLAVSNFIYLLIFIFGIKVTFFTWCINIFWMLLNAMLYFSTKELTTLFEEKEKLRMYNCSNSI